MKDRKLSELKSCVIPFCSEVHAVGPIREILLLSALVLYFRCSWKDTLNTRVGISVTRRDGIVEPWDWSGLVMLRCSESCPGAGCRFLTQAGGRQASPLWAAQGGTQSCGVRTDSGCAFSSRHREELPTILAGRARWHCCMSGAPCCTAHPHCGLCQSRAPFRHVLDLDFVRIAAPASAALQGKFRAAAQLPFAYCTWWQQHFRANALETVLAGVFLRSEKPSSSVLVWLAHGVVCCCAAVLFCSKPCTSFALLLCTAVGGVRASDEHTQLRKKFLELLCSHTGVFDVKTHICSAQRAVRARLYRTGTLLWQLQHSTSVSTETGHWLSEIKVKCWLIIE